MNILEHMQTNGHEQLVVCSDPAGGLKAFIAIHDTTLGPACGGVRIWPHASEDDAIVDVLRLSRAMTYKSAAAGLAFGGGKGLIMADPRTEKNEALLRAFGRCVDSLGGRYYTTEDVGMKPEDLLHIARETRYVLGLPPDMGGSGDTSPLTGLGVYLGMKAAAASIWGSDNLRGKMVAMQGFGNVARQTAAHLLEEDVRLTVTDLNEDAIKEARSLGAAIVRPEEIYDVDADIFSPCALGGILNDETIPRLNVALVAGGANNQLLEPRHGEALRKRGIVYAPDYIINAGGIIQVACEAAHESQGGTIAERARAKTEEIYATTQQVLAISRECDMPTSDAADSLAEQRLQQARDERRAAA